MLFYQGLRDERHEQATTEERKVSSFSSVGHESYMRRKFAYDLYIQARREKRNFLLNHKTKKKNKVIIILHPCDLHSLFDRAFSFALRKVSISATVSLAVTQYLKRQLMAKHYDGWFTQCLFVTLPDYHSLGKKK